MPPLLPIAIALIAGILIQSSGISAIFIFIPVLAAVILIYRKLYAAAIITLTGAFGFAVALIHTPEPLSDSIINRELNYSGVTKEIKEFDSSRMLIVSIDSCEGNYCRPFLAKIFIPSSLPVIDETDRIEFTAELVPLNSVLYLPDETDYNLPLRRHGVIAECQAEPEDILQIYPEPGILNSIYRIRGSMTRLIAITSLSPSAKGFLITTLTGDRSFLSPDTRDIFSLTGLAHVLALSGLHVGILSWIIFMMLMPLNLAGLHHVRIIATICILWIFAIMTGLSPSVVRAVTMATLFLLATLLERVRSPYNSLSFAAIVILIFTPYAIFTIGFQLSFIAVITILLLAEKLNPFKPSQRLLHGFSSYITVSVSAMLGTGLVSAYYFGIFPVYFLITNIIVSLLLPFLLGSGVMLIIATALGLNSSLLCSVIDFIYNVIIQVSTWISSLPGAYIDGINLPDLSVPLYFTALLFLTLYLHKLRFVWLISGIFTAFVAVFIICYDKPVYTDNAIYIPPYHSETSLLIKENRKLWMLTTAHRTQITEVKDKLERKYHKFLSRRGIDSIEILPEKHISDAIKLNGNILHTKGKTFLLVNSKEHLKSYPLHIDYVIVTKGFKGDIRELHDSIAPDTIVLSADIHLRRHNRYANELKSANIPHKELRDKALIIE